MEIDYHPIGITIVRLVDAVDRILHVEGLDFVDETPVFDI